jgi:hypothetical protein
MGGIGWDGGSLEQARNGGGLRQEKVTGGSADGRSSVVAWTSDGNSRPTWFSLGWWCGWRNAEHGGQQWSGGRKVAAQKMASPNVIGR